MIGLAVYGRILIAMVIHNQCHSERNTLNLGYLRYQEMNVIESFRWSAKLWFKLKDCSFH